MYRLSDNLWLNILHERFDEFKIYRIWDENVNFIIFNLNGKRSEIEHRLHRFYWTLKCFGIGYVLNRRYYSSLKRTAFIEISHFKPLCKLMHVTHRWLLTYFAEYTCTIREKEKCNFEAVKLKLHRYLSFLHMNSLWLWKTLRYPFDCFPGKGP